MWDWSFDGKVVSEHIILIFSRSTGVFNIYNISTGYTTSDAQREITLTRSWLWPCESSDDDYLEEACIFRSWKSQWSTTSSALSSRDSNEILNYHHYWVENRPNNTHLRKGNHGNPLWEWLWQTTCSHLGGWCGFVDVGYYSGHSNKLERA